MKNCYNVYDNEKNGGQTANSLRLQMLMDYKTIKTNGNLETVIKKSKFICHAYRISSEDEAKTIISTIKKEHYKANHNCSAYTLGLNQEIQRFSDDGEPSGTAGIPMLEILKKLQLVNCLVIVTRYFGGIKLGTGGLIRAYGNSVKETIQQIGIVESHLLQTIQIVIDYHLYNQLENDAQLNHYQLENLSFTDKVSADIFIRLNESATFIEALNNRMNGKINIQTGNQIYREVAYHPPK